LGGGKEWGISKILRMKIQETDWIYIKKTKFLEMFHDTLLNGLWIVVEPNDDQIFIPLNKIFQVKRGLESYTQRFYRKRITQKSRK
jgi:hypothetical protein